MYLAYTPVRKIVGGNGEIIHNLAQFSYQPKELGKHSQSLSGKTEGVLHSIDDIYQVKTQPVHKAMLPKWREFFASTAASEQFVLDSDDLATSSNQVDPKVVIRVAKSYKEKEVGGPYYEITFKVKQVN